MADESTIKGVKLYAAPMRIKNRSMDEYEYAPISTVVFGGDAGEVVSSALQNALSSDGVLYNILNNKIEEYSSILGVLDNELCHFTNGGYAVDSNYNYTYAKENSTSSSRFKTRDMVKNEGIVWIPLPYQLVGAQYYYNNGESYESAYYDGGKYTDRYVFLTDDTIKNSIRSDIQNKNKIGPNLDSNYTSGFQVKFHIRNKNASNSDISSLLNTFEYKFTKLQYVMKLQNLIGSSFSSKEDYAENELIIYNDRLYRVTKSFDKALTFPFGNVQLTTISLVLQATASNQLVINSYNSIMDSLNEFKSWASDNINTLSASISNYNSAIDALQTRMNSNEGQITRLDNFTSNLIGTKKLFNSFSSCPSDPKNIPYYKYRYRRGNWVNYNNILYHLKHPIPLISENNTSYYSWDSTVTETGVKIADAIYEAIRAICFGTSGDYLFLGGVPIYDPSESYKIGDVIRGPVATNNSIYKVIKPITQPELGEKIQFSQTGKYRRRITLSDLDDRIQTIAPTYDSSISYPINKIFWYKDKLRQVNTELASGIEETAVESVINSNTNVITIADILFGIKQEISDLTSLISSLQSDETQDTN